MLNTGLRLLFAVLANAISMIYAISGPLIAMILFIMPTLSNVPDTGIETLPFGTGYVGRRFYFAYR